jgi:hypothetical protein
LKPSEATSHLEKTCSYFTYPMMRVATKILAGACTILTRLAASRKLAAEHYLSDFGTGGLHLDPWRDHPNLAPLHFCIAHVPPEMCFRSRNFVMFVTPRHPGSSERRVTTAPRQLRGEQAFSVSAVSTSVFSPQRAPASRSG